MLSVTFHEGAGLCMASLLPYLPNLEIPNLALDHDSDGDRPWSPEATWTSHNCTNTERGCL